MTTHLTGTRKEWLAARLELLQAEKDLIHRSDELAQRRRQLPWVPIDKDYRFDTDKGSASLADLAPAGERVARAIGVVIVGVGLLLIARAIGIG